MRLILRLQSGKNSWGILQVSRQEHSGKSAVQGLCVYDALYAGRAARLNKTNLFWGPVPAETLSCLQHAEDAVSL